MSPTTTRQAEPDQACADAVDLARAAAEADAGPGQVGPHVGIEVEGDRLVTHFFASLDPGYVGWRWAVTVSRASRSKSVTVSETVLVPGPDALLAPPWVPWTERVRPGDLKAGDLLPAPSDDERLVPAVAIAGEAGLLDWDESDAWRLTDAADDAVKLGAAIADQVQPARRQRQPGRAAPAWPCGSRRRGQRQADAEAEADGGPGRGRARQRSGRITGPRAWRRPVQVTTPVGLA